MRLYCQDTDTPRVLKREEIEKLKAYQEAQRNYRLTDGKPTKKDRRELDRFMDDWQED